MSNDIPAKSIRLLPIDPDPIFLLGLSTFLAQFPEFEIVANGSTLTEALQQLEQIATEGEDVAEPSIDLVILGIGEREISGRSCSAIAQVEELRARSSQIPLLILDSSATDLPIDALRELGVKGYLLKNTAPDVLVNGIRQIVTGERNWVMSPSLERQNEPTTTTNALLVRNLWLQALQLSANEQMDAQISKLNTQLNNPYLSEFDRFFLLGRRREVRVARWLVNQVLQTVGNSDIKLKIENGATEANNSSWLANRDASNLSISTQDDLERSPQMSPLSNLELKPIQSELFDRILVKLQSHLTNLTDIALEIDILQLEKKQQLLYLVLRQFEEILDNLKYSEVQASGLSEKREILLLDLWEATLNEFFGKYSSLHAGDREIELVPLLMEDAEIVKSSILDKIPHAIDLFSFLLYRTELAIENTSYAANSPEAKQQAEFILENLIIQIANGTVYPLLNQLAEMEEIKQEFFDRRWMSTREIERFRNNLSWRYRWQKYWQEPKSMFESHYVLLVLDDGGIRKMTSYAPRRQDLTELNGLQQTVTLLLETRDAIAPRIQSILVFVGNGGRYVLIQLGRGIGLIAQGILQGIGNSLQELKIGKHREH